MSHKDDILVVPEGSIYGSKQSSHVFRHVLSTEPGHHVSPQRSWKFPCMAGNALYLPLPSLEGQLAVLDMTVVVHHLDNTTTIKYS